jgi:hypothetical protein
MGESESLLPAEADEVQEQTVLLTQAVHFTDATGQDVVVGPGSYGVDAEGTNRIRLLPVETGEPVVIDAVSFTHQETVERPVPVTVPDPKQPDVLHLALLSPDGTGLDAIGTYSGVTPRAVTNLNAAYYLGVYSVMPIAPPAVPLAPIVRRPRDAAPTTGTMTAHEPTIFRMKNYAMPTSYVNIESGALAAGPIQPGWQSAMWTLEQVDAPGVAVYRIRNVWKQDQYLNIESGSVVAGPIQPGWLSGQWKISAQVNNPNRTNYIKNAGNPLFLNIVSGALGVRSLVGQGDTSSALWIIEPVGPPPSPPAAPSDLRIIGKTTTSMTIAWRDNSSGERMFILRWGFSGREKGNYSFFNPNITKSVKSGLTAGTSYCFTVQVESVWGLSAPTPQVCGATLSEGSGGGQQEKTFDLTLTRQQTTQGYPPYSGKFPLVSSIPNGYLKEIKNLGIPSGVRIAFVRINHTTQECGDPNAIVILDSGQSTTPTTTKNIYGTSTPPLAPVYFVACVESPGAFPDSVWIRITYTAP